jgi:hypothetical protein
MLHMKRLVPDPSQALRAIALCLALLPALYVFIAIQYGGLTVPYWDHVELARLIESVKTGSFSVEQLWAPHNHSRPLFYRLIYLPNALMTDWDLRSEYVYIYAAIYAGFFIHAWILFQNRAGRIDAPFGVGLALLSLIYFSPVGHMNHWWSMMLQLQLGNVFILAAIWAVSHRPGSWSASILASLACWIATYTITNGIIAFAICAGIIFLGGHPRRDWPKLAYWVANIALMFVLYLPGLPEEGSDAVLRAGDFIGFIAVYLGLPLGGLLRFEYTGPFSHPPSIALNAACGIALACVALFLLVKRRAELRGSDAAFRFLVAMAGFAILSALITAEGRSSSGAVYANSSRYVIYSSYLLLGLVHYYAATLGKRDAGADGGEQARQDLRSVGIGLVAVILVGFGINAYRNGIDVYRGSHAFNDQLVAVYANRHATDQEIATTYPDAAFARHLRGMLSRFGLGPYRYQTGTSESLNGSAPFVHAIRLEDGVVLRQRFRARYDDLARIDLQFVTWQTTAPAAKVSWSLFSVESDGVHPVGGGTFDTAGIGDWGTESLRVEPIGNSAEHEFELVVRAPAGALGSQLIGLPVFAQQHGALQVQGAAAPVPAPATLGIRLIYGN